MYAVIETGGKQYRVEVGTERARTVARETMREVREAMGLSY